MIFDIGAHDGQDSDFYLRLGHRVIAVEADPVLAAALRERFATAIAAGMLTIVERAMAAQRGQRLKFFANRVNTVWGTTDAVMAERNRLLGADSELIEVETETLDTLIGEFGCPDYIKIDIEGADMACLGGLRHTACRPPHLSIESTKTSWPDLVAEFDLLESLGYHQFQVVRQGCHDHRPRPFTDQAGQTFMHGFSTESSGPFGDMLDGRWMTRQQALRRYRWIFLQYRTFGDNTFGSRLVGLARALHRRIRTGSRDAPATNAGPPRPTRGVRKLIRPGWYDTHARLADSM